MASLPKMYAGWEGRSAAAMRRKEGKSPALVALLPFILAPPRDFGQKRMHKGNHAICASSNK
jgi:hypothetical protein